MPRRSTASSYARPHRPRALAMLNRVATLAGRVGRVALDADSLERAALARAGRERFGDTCFRTPLAELLRSVEAEARLHPLGRFIQREQILGQLVNRLRLEALIERVPELRRRRVEAPVVIAGLQRTGTTLLHRLLGRDPDLRTLAAWEALNPAPIEGVAHGGRARRRRMASVAERMLGYMAPDFVAIHPIAADEPEEEVLLLGLTFFSTAPEATLHVPSFARWLEEQDHTEAYRYLSLLLSALTEQRGPERWLLKTPHHLEHLDVLLDVFPDARILQTHRDPTRTLASFCSMVAHGRGVFSDEVDPVEVGHHWSAKIERMVRRSMAVREADGGAHFLDVLYADLIADPMTEVRRIYDFLERPLTPEAEARMREFLGANPKDKHGRHRYRLEDFGLDPAHEAERFAPYIERFSIPPE